MLDKFDDLGVDAVAGVEVMRLIDLHPDELQDAMRFERLKDVISYLKNVPDKRYFINKVVVGKMVDKLDHLWGYVELHKRKEQTVESYKTANNELSMYIDKERRGEMNEIDKSMAMDLSKKMHGINSELSKLNEEIGLYER